MRNAHLFFGSLQYSKPTKDGATNILLRCDRFIGERDATFMKAHLISAVGSDAEISAIWAGVVENGCFTIEAPGLERIDIRFGSEAQSFRGSVAIPGKRHLVRHLIGISAELALAGPGASLASARTVLCDSDPRFILYRVSKRFGLPVVPAWAEWFAAKLKVSGALKELVGLGCSPVLVYGGQKVFLKWISQGLKRGEIKIPDSDEPELWNTLSAFDHCEPSLGETMGRPAA